MTNKVEKNFFIFNPKSYLFGEELLRLAKVADALAKKYPEITIFVTAPYADISYIAKNTENIIVTAQHMDGIGQGRGMGKVLPESIKAAGAKAVFLNHAENPMTFSQIACAVKRAKDLDMISIICADSIKEAEALTKVAPEIILCEPTELIGTGETSSEEYINATNQAIKKLNSDIKVMQAAGISSAEDVYKTIKLGADGTGCTSGIVKAENPSEMLTKMIKAMVKAIK